MYLKRVHMQFSVCLLSALSGVLLPRVVCLCICMRLNMQMALSAVVCVFGRSSIYIRVVHPSDVVLVLEIATLVEYLPL